MTTILRMLGVLCPEYVWPELTFPSCRCTHVRWHRGPHHDKSGDAWEGQRR
jgi:hypothetical protein